MKKLLSLVPILKSAYENFQGCKKALRLPVFLLFLFPLAGIILFCIAGMYAFVYKEGAVLTQHVFITSFILILTTFPAVHIIVKTIDGYFNDDVANNNTGFEDLGASWRTAIIMGFFMAISILLTFPESKWIQYLMLIPLYGLSYFFTFSVYISIEKKCSPIQAITYTLDYVKKHSLMFFGMVLFFYLATVLITLFSMVFLWICKLFFPSWLTLILTPLLFFFILMEYIAYTYFTPIYVYRNLTKS